MKLLNVSSHRFLLVFLTISVILTMEFESDILGEFSESFRFILRGNEEPVSCQFKGHVVSTSFGLLFLERPSNVRGIFLLRRLMPYATYAEHSYCQRAIL